MRFTINLKPRNSAAYFTVREHLATYKAENYPNPMDCLKKGVETTLKDLFNIPVRLRFTLCQKSIVKHTAGLFGQKVKLDEPQTGKRLNLDGDDFKQDIGMLDLSYSFPYVMSDYQNIRAFFLDPSAALGVPVPFAMVLHSNEINLSDHTWKMDDSESIKHLWLMGQVLRDIENKGLEVIRRECDYKAVVLWQMVENSPYLEAVTDKEHRSKTMITAKCTKDFQGKLLKMGYETGSIFNDGEGRITIANYPVHSKETIELLYDRVMDL